MVEGVKKARPCALDRHVRVSAEGTGSDCQRKICPIEEQYFRAPLASLLKHANNIGIEHDGRRRQDRHKLVPARYRGWTDLVINGSFWIGAALGAIGAIVLLDPALFAPDIGWRVAFLIGSSLGLVIFVMRLWIPESPRWLMTHGRQAEAEAIIAAIDERFRKDGHTLQEEALPRIRLAARTSTPLIEVARTLFVAHRKRTAVGLALMASQAFFYNAIFFTYALVLTDFYGIAADQVGWYILAFAAGNFLGPLLLGRFFHTIGRRFMITATYAASGVLLAGAGYLFAIDALSATGQTLAWSVIFFFASAAASSAYLTVSETFPLEIRALALYAIGTGIGGIAGPWIFSRLIDTGSRWSVFGGYLFGTFLMLAAAIVVYRWGIAAERKSLETIAKPLAAID